MDQQMIGRVAMVIGIALIVVGAAGLVFSGGDDTDVASPTSTSSLAAASTTTSSSSTTSTSTATTASSSSTTTVTSTTSTSSTPSSTTTTTPTTTAAPTESVEDFFTVLVDAFASGDVDTLLGRLNQATLDRYGAEQCRTYLTGIAGTPQPLEFVSSREVGDWEYTTDGLATTISGTTAVSVIRTINDTEVPAELHWQRVDGRYSWFTDCGEPA